MIGSTRDAVARRSGTDTRSCRACEPRYLTTRRRRVETCSVTRWSSRITQSETYSSRPCRVSVPSPRSPVMIAVTPLSFSQRNRRRSSARRMRLVREAAEQRLDRVEHDALGADRVDRVAEADEQAFEVVLARLLDLAALDVHVVDQRASSARRACRGRSRASATFCGQLLGGLLERHEHAGLAELRWRRAPGTPWRTASCRSRRRRRPASAGRVGRPPPVISSSPRMPVGPFGSVFGMAQTARVACSLALLSGYEYFEVHSCVI